MTAPVFVDTNVFIYALDKANPKKHETAQMWKAELWKSRRGRISFQVLQEFYARATQKWPTLFLEVRSSVRNLLEWNPVVMDSEILERAWKIQERYKLSFWDALIVSAAKATSCKYLLTEDLQEGQELDGVLVVNPFRSSPHSITAE
jgi:predicted nucleic acid-binding protein